MSRTDFYVIIRERPDRTEWDPMDRELEEKVRDNPSTRLFAPLADAYRKEGRVDEAIEILVEGLSHHPHYVSARVLLARCYEDMGEWNRAREEWKAVLELDDRSLVAMKAMGEIDRLLGDLVSSREWFRRYLDEFPDDEAVRERLTQVESESSSPANPAYETGTDPEPKKFQLDLTPPEYSDGYEPVTGEEPVPEGETGAVDVVEEGESVETITLAEIYAQQGFYERAIDIYTRILARETENEQIVQRIDELSGKLGRNVEREEESRETSSGAAAEGAMEESADVNAEESSGLSIERAGEQGEEFGKDSGDPDRIEDEFEPEGPIEIVDINHANVLELESVPGVGPVIAQKIVIERERNGPFTSPADLDRVPSLGDRLIERILPFLKFEESSSPRIMEPVAESTGEAAHGGEETGETLSGEEIFEEEEVGGEGGETPEATESEFEDFRRWLRNLRK